MLELILGLSAAAIGGGAFVTLRARRRRARWTSMMREAAGALGGRVSMGGAADRPELRAELEGRTVTLRLSPVAGAAERRGAHAELRLEDALTSLRLYVGWNVNAPPSGLEHLPKLEYPPRAGLEGSLFVRADDAALAARLLAAARLDLVEVAQELGEDAGVELVVRGGYLNLGVRALAPSWHLFARLARAARQLVTLLELAAASPTALPAQAKARRECTLCADLERPEERWVTCARCYAAYHEACFRHAGSCIEPGCSHTRSEPVQPTASGDGVSR